MSNATIHPSGERGYFSFSVDKYHEMLSSGLLPEKNGLELISGDLLYKGTQEPFRITAEKYSELVRRGILTKDNRVELIRGRIVQQMAINPPHSIAAGRLNKWLAKWLPAGWDYRVDQPVRLAAADSIPEPDVSIVGGEDRLYEQRHPVPGDIAIIIEIAESSLAENRSTKAAMYAECMIPEYWIVNLIEKQIEVYTQPSGPIDAPRYAHRVDYSQSSKLKLVLDGVEVAELSVSDVIPH